MLYVYVEATSGNLDPLISIIDGQADLNKLQEDFSSDMDIAVGSNDPVNAINAVRDKYFLAWDDDSGPEYAAALIYKIPKDGDYYLTVSSSVTTLWENAFGNYNLYVGIDAPEVLSGKANNNAVIASLSEGATQLDVGIEIFTDTLSETKSRRYYSIPDVKAGDKLYIMVEALSDDLEVGALMIDFGGKPMATAASEVEGGSASFVYTFPEDSSGYSLQIIGCCGDYRLYAGLNAPEILSGQVMEKGVSVLETGIPVNVGFRLQQITNVDQQVENFSVVATLRMDWYDPKLSFSPEDCHCFYKVYNQKSFNNFIRDAGDNWPDFTFFNQQGNRWIQNQTVFVLPDGHATYLERFSTTFQAPDFNFEKFPFDEQQFYIRIDELWSEDVYYFQDNLGFTELGTQLGEEEWYVTDNDVVITSEESNTENITSRYSFAFLARRHLSFYIIRIFVPIIIVIIVSWFTFFLKDYGKRVDVAGGNLLLFITFNFTISKDLPRLGYLTFMDVILISTFVITALVVIFNVVLKRLEVSGKGGLAARLDTPMIWLYPLLYVVAVILIVRYFFMLP